MCCDDNYIIALADDILTTWNNNLSIPVQAGKQKVILQLFCLLMRNILMQTLSVSGWQISQAD